MYLRVFGGGGKMKKILWCLECDLDGSGFGAWKWVGKAWVSRSNG